MQNKLITPTRAFTIRCTSQDSWNNVETIQAHYQRVGSQGELELFLEAGNVAWSIRTYAAGQWQSVKASVPTQEQLDELQRVYADALVKQQQEQMAMRQLVAGAAGTTGNPFGRN